MRYLACRRTLLVAFFFVLLCKAAAPAQTSPVGRVVTTIADGIYVISHPNAPNGFPNGNTTVIIGDREVLVVDFGLWGPAGSSTTFHS